MNTRPASAEFVQIQITGGVILIDAEDEARVREFAWSLTRQPDGRRCVHNSKLGYLSRWLMNAPHGMEVDHKNRKPFDNRKQNLRICTQQQNCWNRRRSGGKSRFLGVTHYPDRSPSRRWGARIDILTESGRKRTFLGRFPTQLEAALAYDKAAVELFGEFAAPNFPERFK